MRPRARTCVPAALQSFADIPHDFGGAHNLAVREGTNRLRNKGVETRKQKATKARTEILGQLADAGGSAKAVAFDRQLAGKPSSSETSVRRAKKTAPGGSR